MSQSIHSSLNNPKLAVLALTVNNHPGVMSHICGLFARRAFNLESILCMPLPKKADAQHSKMWLRVHDDERLPQITAQLKKLQDVLVVELHDGNHPVFQNLASYCE